MEELMNGLVEKVGLDNATAEKVIGYLKDNASQIPTLLAKAGVADKLPGGLGKLL